MLLCFPVSTGRAGGVTACRLKAAAVQPFQALPLAVGAGMEPGSPGQPRPFHPLQKYRNGGDAVLNIDRLQPILVKIDMELMGRREPSQQPAAPFVTDLPHYIKKQAVAVVMPAALLGQSFDALGGRAPRLFRGLPKIALRELVISLLHQLLAGLNVVRRLFPHFPFPRPLVIGRLVRLYSNP